MKLLKILPKNLLSQTVGRVAQVEKPSFIATQARDWFISKYKLNMNEAELPAHEYPSVAKLFTRRLKPGVRPIEKGLVHPCDGELTCAEVIDSDSLLQVKDRKYSLSQLLTSSVEAKQYLGGAHLIYYLCPTDYHRVHSPIDGEITHVTHVPGQLWPVNNWSVKNINDLFAINERVIFHFRSALGPAALVMVGATNVGKITVSFDPEIVSNVPATKTNSKHAQVKVNRVTARTKEYECPVHISKGEEIGVFNMGSTVVMLYGPQMVNVLPKLGPVKMGQSV